MWVVSKDEKEKVMYYTTLGVYFVALTDKEK